MFFSEQKCDACGGARYGRGIPAIRPINKMFGVKNLPIIFHCCSTDCRRTLMTKSEADAVQMTYVVWQQIRITHIANK